MLRKKAVVDRKHRPLPPAFIITRAADQQPMAAAALTRRCSFCCYCVRRQSQCGATWGIRCKFTTTTCCSTALTLLLPLPHITGPIIGKRDVIHKTGKYVTYSTVVREDRATAADNMYRKFVKFGHVVFEICQLTDGQTDIQTCSSQYHYQGRSKKTVLLSTVSRRHRHLYC